MKSATWHYARVALAKQVLGMFISGLSNALVFFAPRRMGKTQFLIKDVLPMAQKEGWNVVYFSFLECANNPEAYFSNSLFEYIQKYFTKSKVTKLLKSVSKVGGGFLGANASVEFQSTDAASDLKLLMNEFTKHGNTLLLLDEIQALTQNKDNKYFIAALRTQLDIHKDKIKVIFTGSSREGLRQIFSQSDAPFFHFGQNLPFPKLDKDFTDHLADMYTAVLNKKLDKQALYDAFVKVGYVPQLIRSLVERLILTPNLSIAQACEELLDDTYNDRNYDTKFSACSRLDQALLILIEKGSEQLYTEEVREILAEKIGVESVTIHAIQSAVRSLKRKLIIGNQPQRGKYFIDDTTFQNWVLETDQN